MGDTKMSPGHLLILSIVALLSLVRSYHGHQVLRTERLSVSKSDILRQYHVESGLDFWREAAPGQSADIMVPAPGWRRWWSGWPTTTSTTVSWSRMFRRKLRRLDQTMLQLEECLTGVTTILTRTSTLSSKAGLMLMTSPASSTLASPMRAET